VTSPMQRALAECKANGWPAAVVEHFNPHAKIRVDLWGCIDLLVLDGNPGVLGVQACAGDSHAARATKVRETIQGAVKEPATDRARASAQAKAAALRAWCKAGNRIEVWSFAKKGPRGKRKLWELRREPILTFQGVPVESPGV